MSECKRLSTQVDFGLRDRKIEVGPAITMRRSRQFVELRVILNAERPKKSVERIASAATTTKQNQRDIRPKRL